MTIILIECDRIFLEFCLKFSVASAVMILPR